MGKDSIANEQLSADELELKDKIIKYLESADASKENFEEIVKGYDSKVVIKIVSMFTKDDWMNININIINLIHKYYQLLEYLRINQFKYSLIRNSIIF